MPLAPGQEQRNIEVWIADVDNLARKLRALESGKHTLRVARLLNATHAPGEDVLRVVSNAVEIEIVRAESASAAASGVLREVMPAPRKLFSASHGKDVSVVALAFSPNGKTLAAVDETAKVTLRNARAGTQTMVFDLLTAAEREAIFGGAGRQRVSSGAVAFSFDGTRLALGGGPVVKLYDVATGSLELTLVDKRLVDELARSGDPTRRAGVPYAHGRVSCVAFSPDGMLLATTGDVVRDVGEDTGPTAGHLKLWDARTGELKRDLGDYHPTVRSAAFSPDGKTLASVGTHPPEGTSSVRFWDPQTGAVKGVLPIARGGIPWSVAFSPDGSLVAASAMVHEADPSGRQGERGCRLLVWNAQSGALLANRPVPGLASLSFSADSKTLAAGVDGRGVSLWEPETLQLEGQIAPPAELPRDIKLAVLVAASPVGNLLAVGAESAEQGGLVTVWETRAAGGR